MDELLLGTVAKRRWTAANATYPRGERSESKPEPLPEPGVLVFSDTGVAIQFADARQRTVGFEQAVLLPFAWLEVRIPFH